VAFEVTHSGTCVVDQEGPQIAITPLADTEHNRAAAAGAVAWNQLKVRRQLTPVLKSRVLPIAATTAVAGHRTYTRREFSQALAALIVMGSWATRWLYRCTRCSV
jgi:hypothetical protein